MAIGTYKRILFVDNSDTIYNNSSARNRLTNFMVSGGFNGMYLFNTDNYFNTASYSTINTFFSQSINKGITTIGAVTGNSGSIASYNDYINIYGNLHRINFYNDFWNAGYNFNNWLNHFNIICNRLYNTASIYTYPTTSYTQPDFWLTNIQNTGSTDINTSGYSEVAAAQQFINAPFVNSVGTGTVPESSIILSAFAQGVPTYNDVNNKTATNTLNRLDILAQAAKNLGVTSSIYFYIHAGQTAWGSSGNYSGYSINGQYDFFEQNFIDSVINRMTKFQRKYLNIKGFAYFNYSYCVSSSNGADSSGNVSAAKVASTGCPVTTPTNGSTNVSLTPTITWTQTTGPAGQSVLYYIYLGTNSSNLPLLTTATAGTVSIGITSPLLSNTTYYYKVDYRYIDNSGRIPIKVYNDCGVKSFTTTGSNVAPGCPTGLTPNSTSTIVNLPPIVSWTAPAVAGGALTYQVYYGTSNNSINTSAGTTSNTNLSIPGLTNNTTYYWRVVATNNLNLSSSGNVFPYGCTTGSFTTINSLPSCVPTASITPANGSTNVSVNTSINWTSVTNTTGYKVYFGNTPNPPLVTTTTGLSYTPSTLLYNTTYYYRIVATNSAGDAVGCNTGSFTTAIQLPGCPVPSSPANGQTNVSTTPTITWTAGSGGTPTSYNIVLSTSNTLTPVIYSSFNQVGTSYTIPSALTNGTTYYYQITAQNASGQSSACTVYSFTTTASVAPATASVRRILKLNNISTFLGFTGSQNNSDSETSRINYALSLGCNSLQFYGMNSISGFSTSGSSNFHKLKRFISRSKAAGITSVGAIRSSKTAFDEIMSYNNISGMNSWEKFNELNLEDEFWFGQRYAFGISTLGPVGTNYTLTINNQTFSYTITGSETREMIGTNLYNQMQAYLAANPGGGTGGNAKWIVEQKNSDLVTSLRHLNVWAKRDSALGTPPLRDYTYNYSPPAYWSLSTINETFTNWIDAARYAKQLVTAEGSGSVVSAYVQNYNSSPSWGATEAAQMIQYIDIYEGTNYIPYSPTNTDTVDPSRLISSQLYLLSNALAANPTLKPSQSFVPIFSAEPQFQHKRLSAPLGSISTYENAFTASYLTYVGNSTSGVNYTNGGNMKYLGGCYFVYNDMICYVFFINAANTGTYSLTIDGYTGTYSNTGTDRTVVRDNLYNSLVSAIGGTSTANWTIESYDFVESGITSVRAIILTPNVYTYTPTISYNPVTVSGTPGMVTASLARLI